MCNQFLAVPSTRRRYPYTGGFWSALAALAATLVFGCSGDDTPDFDVSAFDASSDGSVDTTLGVDTPEIDVDEDASSDPDSLADAEVDADASDSGNPEDLSCLNVLPLRLFTRDPSAVAVLFRIETCAGETVVLEPSEAQSVFDIYEIEENGEPLSSEAIPDVVRSESQRAYVTLLLDFSLSTRSVEAELLSAAEGFVDAVLEASDQVWVRLEIFDGRPTPITIQLPTRSRSELAAAIRGLADREDPQADAGSTDLNGAIAFSVSNASQWQDRIVSQNDLGVVTSGYVVAFTDGRDSANRVAIDDVSTIVAASRIADGTTEGEANVQTYAVALAGDDFTDVARQNLVEILGDERFIYEGELAELTTRFEELAGVIAEQAEATHLLKYCSAARSGLRQVVFGIRPDVGGARNRIQFEFSADGFAAGCVEFVETVCDDRQCGGFSCGGCDEQREVCEPESGRCVDACLQQNQCTGRSITNGFGYLQSCLPEDFAFPVDQCGGQCVDTAVDDNNCGACGNRCNTLGGAGESCIDGVCACPNGGQVCDGACQVPGFFSSNEDNCGECGNRCDTLDGNGELCVAGTCACPGGGEVCDGACQVPAFFQSDPDNCGACNNQCQTLGGLGEMCINGVCMCPDGGVLCDGACQNPDLFLSDSENCGGCGIRCGDGATCDAGMCTCSDGLACLNNCVPAGSEPFGRGFLYLFGYSEDTTAACGADACTLCGDQQRCLGNDCVPATDGDVRIALDGFLDVFYAGEWRGVCDDSFNAAEGTVACRQLGSTYVSHRGGRARSLDRFWLDDLNCSGEESSLDECRTRDWGVEDCNASEYVLLQCATGGDLP